jgi:hypothetical protein
LFTEFPEGMQLFNRILIVLALIALVSCKKDPELAQPSTGGCYAPQSNNTRSLDVDNGNNLSNGGSVGSGITDDDDDDDDADAAKKKERANGK